MIHADNDARIRAKFRKAKVTKPAPPPKKNLCLNDLQKWSFHFFFFYHEKKVNVQHLSSGPLDRSRQKFTVILSHPILLQRFVQIGYVQFPRRCKRKCLTDSLQYRREACKVLADNNLRDINMVDTGSEPFTAIVHDMVSS